MQKQDARIELLPFSPPQNLNPIPSIEVTVQRKHSLSRPSLSFKYRLSGNLRQILLPKVEKAPGQSPDQRKDDLWKHTCFEAFLGIGGEKRYWELNASPS